MSLETCSTYWQYLNDNSGGIQAISAILTVITTIVLAIITWTYVKLTQRLAESSEENLIFQKESTQADLQQKIIDGSLKFIFRIKNDIDHLHTRKAAYLAGKAEFPDKEKELKELEKIFYEDAYNRIDNQMFPELMFVSFQLQRFENNSLWKDLEQIGELYKEMFEALMSCEDIAEFDKIEVTFMDLLKKYVFKCRDISKIK
jgi:cell division protein FtsX